MLDLLALSAHLPVVEFAPDETVVEEGGAARRIWVLVSGALQVRKGDVLVNTVTRPGAWVGEVSLLLCTTHGAAVEANEHSVMHYAADGDALLAAHPAISRMVAVGLAERSNVVTNYLADLKQQYGDAPGISMVSDVLSQLAQRQAPAAPNRPAAGPPRPPCLRGHPTRGRWLPGCRPAAARRRANHPVELA